MIEEKKKMLDDLLAQANETEKLIFKAFPFQQAIICGNFYAKFPNTTKIIRIFTSSTFTGRFLLIGVEFRGSRHFI
jgi:hypothetical protein